MGTGARMEDIAFNDPGLGSFELKAWRLELSRLPGLSGEPLVRMATLIRQIMWWPSIRGTHWEPHRAWTDLNPISAFRHGSEPERSALGFIFGNTGGGSAVVSFQIPWDHQGSLWSSGEASLGSRGEGAGFGGEFRPVPEPSLVPVRALALSVMGFCRLRAKGTGAERLSKIPEASGITAP